MFNIAYRSKQLTTSLSPEYSQSDLAYIPVETHLSFNNHEELLHESFETDRNAEDS